MESFHEVEGAINDVDNAQHCPGMDQQSSAAAIDLPEAAAHGWAPPVAFEYDKEKDTSFTGWAGNAARYEWNDEYGDVGPRNEELEQQLFHGDHLSRAGLRLDRLNKIEVHCESESRIVPVAFWEDMGLHPIMLENIELCLYERPTVIQMYTIPALTMGKDVIAISQTGSGKTGAFLIPILSKLMGKAKKLAAPRPNITDNFNPKTDGVRAEPLVLIVCPTRELATQIFDDARRLCYRSMLRPCVVYGGAPARFQREELQKGCDILIGTPGRIIDFMGQPHVLSLRRVRFTVLDEADELLQADWEEHFQKIMSGGDANEDDDHRYLMFSATFNKECRKLAREYLCTDYIRIRVGRAGSSHLNIHQQVHYVEDRMKNKALSDLLMSMVPIRTLIFVNSKDTADFVDDYLYNNGFPSTSIHSRRTQREREDAMRAFKTAKCPIMVATAVSARGLDVANIMHVINYDLPKVSHGGITEYTHRIGRTARIGNEGIATSFYNERDVGLASDLVKVLMECGQNVPDFLEGFKPSDELLVFDDDTDHEEEQTANVEAGALWREYGAPEVTSFEVGNTSDEPASGASTNGGNGMTESKCAAPDMAPQSSQNGTEASQWASTETAGEASW